MVQKEYLLCFMAEDEMVPAAVSSRQFAPERMTYHERYTSTL
jgi:hypothetical protein